MTEIGSERGGVRAGRGGVVPFTCRPAAVAAASLVREGAQAVTVARSSAGSAAQATASGGVDATGADFCPSMQLGSRASDRAVSREGLFRLATRKDGLVGIDGLGGAGTIGKAVVAELSDRHEVVIDRSPPRRTVIGLR